MIELSQTSVEVKLNDPNTSPFSKLLGLSWIHFLNDGSANYLPGVLPAILFSLGEPVSMAGAIMSALLIGQAFQPIMGWLADKIGGRILLFIGLISSTIGGSLLGFANNVFVLIGLLFLIGIGSAIFHPQALATVRHIIKQRHGISLSFFMVGGELGRGVWPFLASLLVFHLGKEYLWLAIFPLIITLPFMMSWAPSLPKRERSNNPLNMKEKLPSVILLIGFASTRSLLTFGIITYFPILWNLQGGSLIGGASILTVFLVVGVIGNLGGGEISDHIGRRAVLVTSVGLAAILVPTLLYLHGVFLWVVAGILGILVYSSSPVNILIGQDIFPENRSLGSGLAAGLSNGLAALMVFLVGTRVNESNLSNVFWILAGVGIISLIFALLIPKRYMSNN